MAKVMIAASPPEPDGPAAKIQPELAKVVQELDVNRDQLDKRQALIRSIEAELTAHYNAPNRMIAYVARFGHPHAAIATSDIVGFETLLSGLSGAEQLNVLLHSPGGDGTVIEKLVEMCRGHLDGDQRKLRVIVPNIAKSAATVFALGADQIVMGYCSELGPIDPQVQIAVSNVMQYVSALAFVDSRDKLMEAIGKAFANKEPTVGLMQQLAGLNIPFTQEMENQINFAGQTATRLRVDRPAVISVNVQLAGMAVNELLARLHGFRDEPNARYATVTISITQMALYFEEEGAPCKALRNEVGRGDVTPLLDDPALSEDDE